MIDDRIKAGLELMEDNSSKSNDWIYTFDLILNNWIEIVKSDVTIS
jgi:hypothetical protein